GRMGSLTDKYPQVVISPHLDDGLFACGQLLAAHPRSVVITALAGRPRAYPPLTPWDPAAGFRLGDDVIALRRDEDRPAPGQLGVDRPQDARLAGLRRAGIRAERAGAAAAAGAAEKRRAVQEYRSQLRALAAPGYQGHGDVVAPEGYWRLEV